MTRRGSSGTMKNFYEFNAARVVKRWLKFQTTLTEGLVNLTPDPTIGFLTLAFQTRVNDTFPPSSLNPYLGGVPTLSRMYTYQRPYKFKYRVRIDFTENTDGTPSTPQHFYLLIMPTTTVGTPWTSLFGASFNPINYMAVARKNPYITVRKISVNIGAGKCSYIMKGRTVSLKSLIGFSPAMTFDSAGVPTSPWDSQTDSSPVGTVYYHGLLLREYTSVVPSNLQVHITIDYNLKCMFWGRKRITYSTTSANSV